MCRKVNAVVQGTRSAERFRLRDEALPELARPSESSQQGIQVEQLPQPIVELTVLEHVHAKMQDHVFVTEPLKWRHPLERHGTVQQV